MKSKGDTYRSLFEHNPEPMWVWDRETHRFLVVNQAAIDLYGYTREVFLGMRLDDVDVETAGRGLAIEVTQRDITYAGRTAVLEVLVDVTRRKQLEAQLLHAQKMEAVGMLAGGIAHDFNNLLTIITGYSQLLIGSLPESDRNHSAAEQIMKAGQRAAGLTSQLLSFSRRQALQPKVLDLNLLSGSLAVMLRRLIGEDIDLRLDLGRDLGQVSADPGQIEQVIMNLAVNARDAMPQGGTLTLRTSNVYLDENYTATHTRIAPGHYVMLMVSDTGVGMDAGTRSRLFEPFFTTKGQGRGTGLGLSIVFGIVRQSGGNVEVSSEPGRGTSVKIYLPRVDQAREAEVEAPPATSERGTETILLVEDEEMVRKMIRETLEREGYKVLEADGPLSARRTSRTYAGAIHLMITDVVMPKEGGRLLAARLARTRPDMKVLYMSGYVAEAAPELTDAQFLQKPFTPAALAQKVREILSSDNGGKCRHAGE